MYYTTVKFFMFQFRRKPIAFNALMYALRIKPS